MNEELKNQEAVQSDLKTSQRHKLPAHYLENGGPGRPKGLANKFTLQKNEFFKACRNGKLFDWVQQKLESHDEKSKLEILRVWASLQPREVRSEFDRMPVNIVIVRADGTEYQTVDAPFNTDLGTTKAPSEQ